MMICKRKSLEVFVTVNDVIDQPEASDHVKDTTQHLNMHAADVENIYEI